MKKLLRILAVLVLLLVVLLGIGVLFIDRAVVAAVEKGGTYALGVETKLDGADIGLGSFGLEGLSVANPPGFEGAHFLVLGTGQLEVETGSILADQIVAPLLELREVTVELDRGKDGTNYGVILKNLERFESKDEAPEPPEEGGKTVLVQKLRIHDVTAHVNLIGVAPITVTIPEIAVDDLDSSGMTAAQIASLLVRTLLTSILQAGGGILPDDILKDLGGQLQNVGTVALEITGDVVKGVTGEIEKATEGLGEAGKAIGEAAGDTLEKAGDSLKDVLKKKP
jgi:hypothetical protein